MTRRLPVVAVLAALVVAALAVDRAADDEVVATDAPVDLASGAVVPVASPSTDLSSTWFCAGGTADEEAFADHVITVLNPAEEPVTVTVTAFAGRVAPPPANPEVDELDPDDPEPDDPEPDADDTGSDDTAPDDTGSDGAGQDVEPVVRELEVGAASRRRIAMTDLVSAPVASALVEAPVGGIVVEHEISSIHGDDHKPCATDASDTWHFAWGTTAREARELLVLFNPFPDAAIVDGRFSTEDGVREPVRFDGLVVPARSTLAVDLGDDVTRREEVAATITTRTGRIVADRVVRVNETGGVRGLTVQLGVPVPREVWVFPDGFTSDVVHERFAVYNPGEEVAEVDIELVVDRPDENGIPEPVSLSLPPGTHTMVDLTEDGRVPAGVAHSAIVRSANGVPVVAERILDADGDGRRGLTVTTGSPLLAETWTFASGATSAADDEWLVVVNLDPVVLAEVSVTAVVAGQRVPVSELSDLVVEAGERLAIRVGERIQRDDLALVVTSTEPVVVERARYDVGDDERGMSNAIGVPSPEGVVAPGAALDADLELDPDDLGELEGIGEDVPDEDAPPTAPDDVELPEPDETIVIDDPDAEADDPDEPVDDPADGGGDEGGDGDGDGSGSSTSSPTTEGGVPATTP